MPVELLLERLPIIFAAKVDGLNLCLEDDARTRAANGFPRGYQRAISLRVSSAFSSANLSITAIASKYAATNCSRRDACIARALGDWQIGTRGCGSITVIAILQQASPSDFSLTRLAPGRNIWDAGTS